MNTNQVTIEAIDTKQISESDLIKIARIEQDMWAREEGIGEYVICPNCNKVHSKEEIFGHLSSEISSEIVYKIEEILGLDSIKCKKCGTNTKHAYGDEYKQSIKERYEQEKAFLTVYRDTSGEIRGFFDGYITDFETIYQREFEYYYGNIGIKKIREIIENTLGSNIPNELLICSALGMEEKYKNFFILYAIMKAFFENIHNNISNKITGIAESSIGSNTHSIYHSVGAKKVGISENKNYFSKVAHTKEGIISDIFIHPNITEDYINKMSVPVKSFLRENKGKMREVMKVAA